MTKKRKREHAGHNPNKPAYRTLKAPGFVWSLIKQRCETNASTQRGSSHAIWYTDIAMKIRDALNDMPFSDSEVLQVEVEIMLEKRHADWLDKLDLTAMAKPKTKPKKNPAIKEAADRLKREGY